MLTPLCELTHTHFLPSSLVSPSPQRQDTRRMRWPWMWVWTLESGEGTWVGASLDLSIFKLKRGSGLGVPDNHCPLGGSQFCGLSRIRYVKVLYRHVVVFYWIYWGDAG